MKAARMTAAVVFLAICLAPAALHAEWTGRAEVGIGYTFLDETGNKSVSPENYDIYEDLGISIRNVRVQTTHRYQLTGDFENINLDNRAINARLHRPGRLSIGGFYRKSLRIYDFDGARRTFRTRGGLDIAVTPHRALKVFGGYARTGRDGSFVLAGGSPFSAIGGGVESAEPQEVATDFSLKTFYVGAQFRHRRSTIDIRYRGSDFADKLNTSLDRKGQYIRAQAFSPIPRFEQVILSGGFSTGWNEIETRDEKRTENIGWGSVAWNMRPDCDLSYKLLFSRTDNEADGRETDNAVSTLILARRFPHRADVSLAYEFRSQDDLVDRTETNAIIAKGTILVHENLRVRGQVAFAQKNDDERTTLVGGEEVTRQRWEIRYDHPTGHRLTLRYRDRRRNFTDIGAEADFSTFSTTATMNLPRWGTGFGTYSYSKGNYSNMTGMFKFEQHVISARITSVRHGHVQLTSGLTYLRSRLRADIEKIIFAVGADVDLTHGYQFNIRYNAHNYDDFMVSDRYYTANVVTVDLQKELNF